jgi:DKNYY family
MENTPTATSTEVMKKNVLFEVTPLSKVLAAIVFIIMPFLGFWLGVQYASVDTVDVQTSPLPTSNVDHMSSSSSAAVQENSETMGFLVKDGKVYYKTEQTEKDKRSIEINILDASTLTSLNKTTKDNPLGLLYAKDNDTVVVGDHLGTALEIPDADPATFTILAENFARDDRSVFVVVETGGGMAFEPRVIKIADADPASFTVLSSGYAKDAKRVYFSAWNQYEAQVVANADPATFYITEIESTSGLGFKAKDASNFFDFGSIDKAN